MQLTKGAIGNLINRYKAVLKKCHLMNTFGSLAVAGMLVMGGAGVAGAASAEEFSNKEITGETLNSDASYLMGGYIQSSGEKLDEAKFSKNTITHTGNYLQGGIIKRSYAPELSITNSEFSGNSVSTTGYLQGGIINHDVNEKTTNITESKFNDNIILTTGNYFQGGIINNNGGTIKINNSEFNNNNMKSPNYLQGGIINNNGINESVVVDIENAKFNNNTINSNGFVQGGIIINDSISGTSSIDIVKSEFANNKINSQGSVTGGIILNDCMSTGDYLIAIDNTVFSKNEIHSEGNLRGSIINNQEDHKVTINSSSFESNISTVKGDYALGGAIYNEGELTFTGNNTFTDNIINDKPNDIYNAGTITVKDGTTTLNSGLILAANSTTNVSGGALVINGTTTWEKGEKLGSLTVNGGALTLQKGDVLEDYDKAKEDTSLSVNSGSLYLINKDNYTAENLTDAKQALNVTDASFGFVGGTLVDEDNKVTDLVVSGDTINSATEFKDDTVLADTKVDNSSFLENDLTVTADTSANVTINGADVAVNKVNIETSATGDKSLTINNNGSLTVVGGDANDKLIAANGDDLKKINVEAGELNLGSAAMPERGAGTLGSAEITLDNDGSLNASNGDYTVGGVTGTGKVTADAANIKATGDVAAGGINLAKGGSVTSEKSITVTGPIANADGTLQAGEDIAAAGQNLTQAPDGKLTVVAGGTIEAAGITATNVAAKKLTATGAVAVDGGTLNLTGTGTDASEVDSLKLTNGTQATVADLTLDDANKTLTVGTGDDKVGGTTLSAQHIDLNDGMLLVDPAWGLASSNVAVESLSAGSVGVGRNSYLALGTADTGWLPGVVGNYTKGVGLSETGITAALGVFKGIEIADNKNLTVDGSKTGTEISNGWTSSGATNSAEFANNSLLVVNGANIYGDKAAIKFAAASGGTLTVAEGAKLVVTDAVAGQDYTIVANAATVQDGTSAPITDGGTVWKTEGLSTTTDMISLGDAKYDATDKKVTTTSAVRNDAHTVFPNLSDGMANAVNDLYTGHAGAAGQPNWDYADVDSADMGVRFLSRATDNRYLGMDKKAAAESIESAARIAFAGAAPQMTKMASDAGTNAVVNRLGFANPVDGAQAMDAEGKIVDRNTTGFALWIAPLWQSQHGWGMDAGNMDYGFNGNLGGVSLGADYTFENAIRAGITFNIGGGYAESSGGDLSSTENRMNFWGLGAYAGWNYENFGVMADVSYTSTWNQLKQDLDSRLGMGNELEADVQATAISAGLRAEYLLRTSVLDIIPHIGVRYMSLNTWGYDVEADGGNVLEGDSLHQDIWTFPVGVTFSKEFATDSGWNFKPSLDFTVIPAAGDIEARHDVAFTGLPGTYEVETQMMDYLTWQGGVGLELANDNMSIGVNYTLQAGQHTTGHGVFGSFRYEF